KSAQSTGSSPRRQKEEYRSAWRAPCDGGITGSTEGMRKAGSAGGGASAQLTPARPMSSNSRSSSSRAVSSNVASGFKTRNRERSAATAVASARSSFESAN